MSTAHARTLAGSLRSALDGPDGFAVFRALDGGELGAAREAIASQWAAALDAAAPAHAGAFRARGLARYHELSHLVDHAALWPKSARMLPAAAVAAIRSTRLCRLLEDEFGPFEISDEEGLGREEITWRIVRPRGARDTGPVHADRWFWHLGHGHTPPGCRRVKVWVAVVTEPGLSGLRVVPGSHRRAWRYHGELRDGFVKPRIDEDVDRLDLRLLPTEPGDAVVFHDGLLHGGGESLGVATRVSFEFTMFVRPWSAA
jgi:hypothetical protein